MYFPLSAHVFFRLSWGLSVLRFCNNMHVKKCISQLKQPFKNDASNYQLKKQHTQITKKNYVIPCCLLKMHS